MCPLATGNERESSIFVVDLSLQTKVVACTEAFELIRNFEVQTSAQSLFWEAANKVLARNICVGEKCAELKQMDMCSSVQ